jgi:hypothetical protein
MWWVKWLEAVALCCNFSEEWGILVLALFAWPNGIY